MQLHARENARASLHPNKEVFKLKKTPALNQNYTLQSYELLVSDRGPIRGLHPRIVNAWRWLSKWTSSFVSCFCPYFWP